MHSALKHATALPARAARWLTASRTRSVLAVTLGVWVASYFYLVEPEHKQHASFLSRSDGTWMYLQLRSHVLDRDVDYRNDYAVVGFHRGHPKWDIWLGHTKKGHPRNAWTMGTGFMLAPFFILGHLLVLLSNALGARISTFGTSLTHQYATFGGSVVYAFWGLVLMVRFARRRFGEGPALLACLTVTVASPLYYYSTYCPSYSHAVAFFCAAALLHLWDRHLRVRFLRHDRPPDPRQLTLDLGDDVRPRPPHPVLWVGFGAVTGLAALVRPQLAVFALPGALAGLHWVWRLRRQRRALALQLLGGAGAAAGAVLVFSPQMLYWKAMYDAYLVVPQGAWFMQWEASFLWETLFSARAGLLVITPLLWFAALGLLLMARRYPADAALLTGLLLLCAWANGAAWDFWGGGTFSARRMTCAVTTLMVGGTALLVVVRDLARRRAAWVGGVAAALLVAPLIGFTQWHMKEVAERPTQSSHYPDRDATRYWTEFLKDTHDDIGNPLSYPHALWVWLAHDVPVSGYTRITTDFPLQWPPPWVSTPIYSSRRAQLDLSTRRWRKLVAGGAYPERVGKGLAWRSGGRCMRLFLPLRARYRYQLRVRLLQQRRPWDAELPEDARDVVLKVNGRPVRAATTAPTRAAFRPGRHPGVRTQWKRWVLEPREVRVGINHLQLCGQPGQVLVRRLELSYRR